MLQICHIDGGVERDRNHLHEGVLPLLARELLGAVDVIGDREQAERALAYARAAFMYRPAASISTASTPIFFH